ncbi:PREDICTED: uncharacterized protein LOC104754239 [Camelina sativa]|uniref:Uncharacterized protein LOC104754239 n=1 Tax=Camelina sativa TaxID=90675 RepID=A0ABM0WQD7_CAMSA|nr:PREDICTED: uncharacterized protein LOC104754239 [Camelina sativa]
MKHVNPSFIARGGLGPVTMVYWDINSCPVPPGCDASLVGPCIKRFLKKEGCSGPLSITAIGRLTEVPNDILEGVYSSGIALNNIFYGFFDTLHGLLSGFMDSNPPPANFMVISDAKSLGTPFPSMIASGLKSRGYNVLQPVPWDSLSLFSLEDDKCVDETSESAFWICSICDKDLPYQGFENFNTHVTSRRHKRELLDYLPADHRFTRREEKEEEE